MPVARVTDDDVEEAAFVRAREQLLCLTLTRAKRNEFDVQ
jgi:hypothetical protein